MPAAERLLDIWIVDLNTVYRDVPYAVVLDWLQQGRLVPEDQVRPAGGKKWYAVSAVPAFVPYLPQPAAVRVDDQAEALEPVELDVPVGQRHEEEDEDVDMIPLIDISLVLLIFFMMTASVSSGFLALIETPAATHQLSLIARDSLWIGLEPRSRSGLVEKGPEGKALPWYSLGVDQRELLAPTTDKQSLLTTLAGNLGRQSGQVQIRLRADKSLAIETIRAVTLELQGLEATLNKDRPAGEKLQFHITGEVSEPKSK